MESWIPTYTGFGQNLLPTDIFARSKKIDSDLAFISHIANNSGSSNANIFTITLPYPAKNTAIQQISCTTKNNGTPAASKMNTTPGSNIVSVFPSISGANNGFSTSGLKGVNVYPALYEYESDYKKLIFAGNSLLELGNPNGETLIYNGQSVPMAVYDLVRQSLTNPTFPSLAYTSLAISGQTMQGVVDNMETKEGAIITEGDYLVLWEIRNFLNTGGTVQECKSLLQEYADYVRGLGAKLLICTGVCSDKTGGLSGLWPLIQEVNQWVRDNQISLCDGICDLADNSLFNTISACANTAYYTSDKLHFKKAAQDIQAGIIATDLQTMMGL